AMARSGALKIPVIGVNDTATKQLFDNTYGTGQSSIDAILRSTNRLLAGQSVVVAGYGHCGRGVARRAAGMGASVIVTEVDPVRALDARMSGLQVLPMEQAAERGDVFITVTGNRDVIRPEHLARIKDGALLLNAGHFDVEIDVGWLRENATVRNVRPGTEEFSLADGRRILLLAEGRVANLAAAEGHPPAVMDMAFSDQALTAAWLAGHADDLEPGVHEVPAGIDAEVARLKLASMDIAIDELNSAQLRYLDSWEQGS
ncbi:MAG: adenosylhomocysteinase, partial [Candidatus Limnocylindrales bacterium]